MENAKAGRGKLCFEKVGEKTVATEAFSKSPLKLLTPKNTGSASWVYSSNFGGGFVGGDSIDIGVHVKKGAEALLLSQASTKVYRSKKVCHQSICGHIEENATFYSLPDPVVCFAGANFHQTQKFYLEENSALATLDTLHCGREHSGERWAFDRYKNEIQIFRKGKRIFFESMLLDSTAGDLKKRHSRFNALSLLVMTGPLFKIHSEEIMNSLNHSSPIPKEDFVISASMLGTEGIVIRMASVETEILADALKEALSFLPQRLGDDPWARKW
jgi:urease accessory protein